MTIGDLKRLLAFRLWLAIDLVFPGIAWIDAVVLLALLALAVSYGYLHAINQQAAHALQWALVLVGLVGSAWTRRQ